MEAAFAAVLGAVCGSYKSHLSLTEHRPQTCFYLNPGFTRKLCSGFKTEREWRLCLPAISLLVR